MGNIVLTLACNTLMVQQARIPQADWQWGFGLTASLLNLNLKFERYFLCKMFMRQIRTVHEQTEFSLPAPSQRLCSLGGWEGTSETGELLDQKWSS